MPALSLQVLTVEASSCRIQFERRELGVEMVVDTDIMPVNPLECLPAALLHGVASGQQGQQLLLNGHSFAQQGGGRPRGRGWAGASRTQVGVTLVHPRVGDCRRTGSCPGGRGLTARKLQGRVERMRSHACCLCSEMTLLCL